MLTGDLLIGGASVRGRERGYHGIDPSNGAPLEPEFGGAGAGELDRACALAAEAFDAYREAPLEARARFLELIAQKIVEIGDPLIDRASQETGLPRARIESERGRTAGQLRLFAEVVRDGAFLDLRIDHAQPSRTPVPRSDMRLRNVPLGPVAVFGASNFPLAFSVAGGDTASALAAGCPVVVKAHQAHPGTSELVGRAVQAAAAECKLPAGVFALLHGVGNWLGGALVADPRIKAVGFTGSRGGGLALQKIANERHEPIPVYAEMSSINPVFVLPHALRARGDAIARAFVASLTMGAGQFCTNPGLVIARDGPDLDAFASVASSGLAACPAATMLTPGIHAAFARGVERLGQHPKVDALARGQSPDGPHAGQSALFSTSAAHFLSDASLSEEIFGASSLLVRCESETSMHDIVERMEGQLTVTLQMDDGDAPLVRALLPALERKAGRILINGFPTGVEVAHAMVHGGPYPATTDGRSTSVGTLAIRRFLRPVCYQDFPDALLPEALRDADNALPRLVDGGQRQA
jgi:NADP-dependent aldehyde dehydrogenase